ncbi:MAG: hypothetical protein AB2L14_36420 [Candidatus Xenobiia bacterium LiM19]
MNSISDNTDFFKSVFLMDSSPNKVESYEPYMNVQKYLAHLWSSKRQQEKEIGKACGYRNLSKFHNRIDQWLSLCKDIPLSFFEKIGGDLHIIEKVLEIDQADYDRASERIGQPKVFIIKWLPGVYSRNRLPDNLTEAEAIEYLKEYSRENGLRCIIQYPCILDIVVNPDGKIWRFNYRPSMKIKSGTLSFSNKGSGMWTTTIG